MKMLLYVSSFIFALALGNNIPFGGEKFKLEYRVSHIRISKKVECISIIFCSKYKRSSLINFDKITRKIDVNNTLCGFIYSNGPTKCGGCGVLVMGWEEEVVVDRHKMLKR